MVKTQFFVVFAALSMLLAGCASSSKASSKSASQTVAAEPPSPAEDTPKALPKGPEVYMDKAHVQPSVPAEVDEPDPDDLAADVVITHQQIQAFIKKGPSFALTQVEVKPARADGAFTGFEIVSMKPGAREALASRVVKGDVITHINGVRVKKPNDYLNAWKLLEDVSKIRIDFVRDGQAQHATWRVQ